VGKEDEVTEREEMDRLLLLLASSGSRRLLSPLMVGAQFKREREGKRKKKKKKKTKRGLGGDYVRLFLPSLLRFLSRFFLFATARGNKEGEQQADELWGRLRPSV